MKSCAIISGPQERHVSIASPCPAEEHEKIHIQENEHGFI